MKRLNLSIPTPCHENWDAMTPQQQGRFCGSCQKTVVDFTKMTDQQVLNYFSEMHGGNTCGKFSVEQLDRDMVLQNKKSIPWFKYFLNIMIPAMIASKSYSQGRVYKKAEVICASPKAAVDTTDLKTVKIVNGSAIEVNNLSQNLTLGEVIVVGYMRPKVKPNVYHQFKQVFTDTLRALAVKLYPNPIRLGNSIQIEYNTKQSGNYEIAIADMNGIIVQSNKFTTKTSLLQEDFPLNGITIPGTYLMTMMNDKGQKIWKKKIIVQ